MGAFGTFNGEESAKWEASDTRMKCAEVLLPNGNGSFMSKCGQRSIGIGLLVDQARTPLFRAYNYDAWTNNGKKGSVPFGDSTKLYSMYKTHENLVYVTKYREVAAMLQLHHNYNSYLWTEATIGDGKRAPVYKAVVCDTARSWAVRQQAIKMAAALNVEVIWVNDLKAMNFPT
jgi:hypothetical protein